MLNKTQYSGLSSSGNFERTLSLNTFECYMLHAHVLSLIIKSSVKALETCIANIATSRAPIGAKRKYPKPADVGMLDQV